MIPRCLRAHRTRRPARDDARAREPLDYLQPEGVELAPGDVVHVPLAGRSVRGVVVEAGGPSRHAGKLGARETRSRRAAHRSVVLEPASGSRRTTARRRRARSRWRCRRACGRRATRGSRRPAADGGTARRRALLELLADGPRPLAELVERAGTTSATVRRLEKDGLVALDARLRVPTVEAGRTPKPGRSPPSRTRPWRASRRCSRRAAGELLLHGVTGSGKTEVYLRAIERALARGRSGARARARDRALAADRAAASPRASATGGGAALRHLRRRAPRGARGRRSRGDARVVVGARSAMFAPLPGLGLIVVDEEHDRPTSRARPALRRAAAWPPSGRGSRAPSSSWARPRRVPRAGTAAARDAADARRRQPAARGGRRPAPRRPLSALAAAAHRADPARRRGRQGDPAAQPARRGARRCTAAAAARASAAPAAMSASRCTPAAACAATTAATPSARRALPGLRLGRLARLGAGTERVSEAVTRAAAAHPRAAPGRRRDRAPRAASRPRSSASPASPRPCSSAPRWSRRATTSAICGWPPRSTPTGPRVARLPRRGAHVRAAHAARRPQRPARRSRLGRVPGLGSRPARRAARAEHAVEPFLRGELERRERLGLPALPAPRAHRGRGRAAGAAMGRCRPCAPLRSRRCAATSCSGPAPLFRLRGRERAQLLVKTLRPARAGSLLAELVARQGRALRGAEASAVVDVDPQ